MNRIHNLTNTDISTITRVVCVRRRDTVLRKGHLNVPFSDLVIWSAEPPLLSYPIEWIHELMLVRVDNGKYLFERMSGHRRIILYGYVQDSTLIIL